jgi:hypothetical protein
VFEASENWKSAVWMVRFLGVGLRKAEIFAGSFKELDEKKPIP